ncbi:MAG: CDP-glucose 4,6-dehydratase [Bdellovibrionales bacterium]|nr:CDP-glucose 4,6-dehydratase [Bdellovibrionales bacterium]
MSTTLRQIDYQFWKGKKVFLTGHTGFKGSWLSVWLKVLGAEVYGYSLKPETTPSMFNILNLEQEVNSQIGDIRDYKTLEKSIKQANPDILFHLAAQPLVRKSYSNPVETFQTNIMGTVHILEISRYLENLKSIVIVTTDKCYENKEWLWGYRENDRLGGFDPYSNSKACAEMVTSAYRNSFYIEKDEQGVITYKKALSTARAGNVIGGGDWAEDRLVPDMVRAAFESKNIEIRNPHSVRPWQHVLEPLMGYLMLAESSYHNKQSFSQPFNFGPKEEDCISVGEITKKVNQFNNKIKVMSPVFDKEKPHEATLLKLDISKSNNKLNWKPRWNIEEALTKTWQWYSAYYNEPSSIEEVTKSKINSYMRPTQ